jgi:hypothetical protein
MQSFSRQRLGKYMSTYRTVLCNTMTSSTIQTLFSVWSVQSAHKRSEFRSKLFQGSGESVASQLPVGHSHGKFLVEEELEVGL